ncbi:hypothetical protein [Arthrobacter agilis]|uniref:hypothetical protein n=1 Tax=Arthrobacter agilis TaxID=37921 RepID=UPI0027822EA2|nr:hypothetical protein [Arthrobacter agilis]MDQ0736880.1 hypothetical protein [Arthrobacter agilis]
MHREGLFFDPLEAEEDAPGQPGPAQASEPVRHRRQDPEDLKIQRQRELARVQDDLRRMASGPRRH